MGQFLLRILILTIKIIYIDFATGFFNQVRSVEKPWFMHTGTSYELCIPDTGRLI